jgi:SAM-dependent methyltransferase
MSLRPDPGAAIAAQYARRDTAADERRYSLFDPAALQAHQERQRALIGLWRAHGWYSLSGRSITEVGCGTGGNLLDLLRLGATPALLQGIELLPERVVLAKGLLPGATTVLAGDATNAPVEPASQDAVLAFTVFSSLLDDDSQRALAAAMWRWVRPGGGVLVHDLAIGNPRNRDVRGVPVSRLHLLFPGAPMRVRRVTLAPPLARMLGRLHPGLPGLLAPALHCLKTHRLAWIPKP